MAATAPKLTSPAHLRIFIVSAVKLYRDALVSHLETAPNLCVVGAGDFSAECFGGLAALAPQIVLIDMGVSLRREELLPAWPASIRALALGIVGTDDEILACGQAGLSGYVPHQASLEDLVQLMHDALGGKFAGADQVTASLVRRIAKLSQHAEAGPASEPPLTRRQREVSELLRSGLTNKEIGRALSICPATVRNHVHAVFEKLNVKRRAQAIAKLHVAAPPARSGSTGTRASY
jgi:DNA-binding NarL/FixJ family response regulator